ncbi:hypothetical protein CIL05_17180 [Virgibacillus profundi]|uniref:Uncharacterized protein n=1 Tax=Virgibacillus profundi TaxID=2024555 RepID=A0A2A2IAL0_9BACI|nr:hypothetical protein [Virgibacillus profundi]PAV28366.1 hypothetical protein CIL05_17180 [Virgibacillus profundi]PXY52272.1 hypothetical protein CIT14_18595 [Virgibacillus profundi]
MKYSYADKPILLVEFEDEEHRLYRAAYGLVLILQLQTKSKKILWPFEFMEELHRKKIKTSRGRQKVPIPNKKETEFIGNVAYFLTILYGEKRE